MAEHFNDQPAHPCGPKRDSAPRDSDAGINSQFPVFFTVKEAAKLLRLSPVTLGRWRAEGVGPPHRKFGRKVIYDQADLIHWAAAQKRTSTSEEPHDR